MTVAIVGTGPGIGLAVARRFGREGERVALLARREDALRQYQRDLGDIDSTIHPVDVTDPDALAAALKAAGPVSVLVYNAVMFARGKPLEVTPAELAESLQVNAVAPLAAVQAVAGDMIAAGRGSILMTNGGVVFNSAPHITALGMGKCAARSLARSLFQELRPHGIRVTAVTVCGPVPADSGRPDLIAEEFWALHQQPEPEWTDELVIPNPDAPS